MARLIMKNSLILVRLWALLGLFSIGTFANSLPAPIFENIGDGGFRADTQDLLVQKYFNQGYEALCHKQGFKPVDNFLNQHNYDFLFTSAIFAGRADVAYQIAEDIRKKTPLAWLNKSIGFQRFYALKFYAIAYFGGWEQLKPLEKSLLISM